MEIEEILQAYEDDEILEYHLMGVEYGANRMPGSGWYSCTIDEIYENGNVEISFTDRELAHLGCTVLKKNIPIAFRRRN